MHVLVSVLWYIGMNRISVFILGIVLGGLGMCTVVNVGNRLCI